MTSETSPCHALVMHPLVMHKIDFSIGLSVYDPINPLSVDRLIHIADENMYKEKKSKKKKIIN